MAMLAMARSAPGAVLDSTFYPYTVPHIERLPGTVVEVRCRCPPAPVDIKRLAERIRAMAGPPA
jgi:hypothetical protein